MLNEHGDRILRDLNSYTAPIYMAFRMRHIFNYAGYQAHCFRQPDQERFVMVGRTSLCTR